MSAAQPQPQQQINVNVARLSQLKAMLEKMGEQRKTTKSQLDEIETQAIDALMRIGIRYIDESGNGAGPFWVLGKQKNDGSWSNERYTEFFTTLMSELRAGKQFTPEQCAALAQQYLKQFEKRRLCLNKLSQARQRGVEDLRAWLAGGNN